MDRAKDDRPCDGFLVPRNGQRVGDDVRRFIKSIHECLEVLLTAEAYDMRQEAPSLHILGHIIFGELARGRYGSLQLPQLGRGCSPTAAIWSNSLRIFSDASAM